MTAAGAPTRPQTVVVADEDAIVRHWVRASLAGSEFTIVGEAEDGATAWKHLEALSPSILLLERSLENVSAVDLIQTIRTRRSRTSIVVMTSARTPGLNEAAFELGAHGVFLKRADPRALLQTLRTVVSGHRVREPAHPARDPAQARLSPRERQVLRLVQVGKTNPAIARDLGISVESAKTLLYRAFAKLGAHNRVEAISLARERWLM